MVDNYMNKNVNGRRLVAVHSKLMDDRVSMPIRKEPMADYYSVDQRPFARGKFATVRRCRHKETGVDYAAKFIRKRRRAMDVRHEILHEIAVLELCRSCDHIVGLHEVYETTSEMVLVLELAAGGEVQRLIDEDELLDEKDVVRLMRQFLEGLSFMHDRNIAHLDIKPQNLLFTTTAYPHCDLKLCDFGISRVITKGIEIREIVGTPDYVAPEILNYEPISLATDMWSVGVLTYVLLTGHSPFAGDDKQETFVNISQVNLEFPDDLFLTVSAQAKDFIRKLLVQDPSERLTARDCFTHPWLRQNDNHVATTVSASPAASPRLACKASSSPSTASLAAGSLTTSSMPLCCCPTKQSTRPTVIGCDKENINVAQLERQNRRFIMDEGVVC